MARVRKPSSDGWYIANFERREFVREASSEPNKYKDRPEYIYVRYTTSRGRAYNYRGRLFAERRAAEINAQAGAMPCSVVTAEAARCLDLIWMRERRREQYGELERQIAARTDDDGAAAASADRGSGAGDESAA